MEPKEEIRRRIDVAELIGEYLNLKPAGSGSFKSPCPFHQDKDPSFYVSQDKQIWHCFGCDMGGDIFAFVMEIESVDFPEALRILGKKAGVEITRFVSSDSNERQRMIGMHELAVKFYRKVLVDSTQAAGARSYLENRGIAKELAEKFQLGFAPEAWDTLVNFMSKRGYSATEIEKAGLGQRKKSGIGSIDKFRNRIMIPLADHHSNVVGFTGRIMKSDGEDHGPKYMNSPETLIYKKSELLYGLDLAKRSIKQSSAVIIVEGNLDVVASHKAGVENVVASSGTALTEQQVSLLKRYTDTIVFSFDQDAAGFAAARRGIHLAQKLDMKVKVIILSSEHGKDPDDVIQKDPQLWIDAVANPVPIMDYYFKRVVEGKDLNDVEHKQSTGKFLIEEIAMIADNIVQEHWLQKLSDLIKTEVNVLRGMVAKKKTGQKSVTSVVQAEAKVVRTREDRSVMAILGVFLQNDLNRAEIVEKMNEDGILATDLKELYKYTLIEYNNPNSNSVQQSLFANLREKFSQNKEHIHLESLLNEVALIGEQIVNDQQQDQVQKQLNDFIQVLTKSALGHRRTELQNAIRQAEEQGDEKVVKKLIEEFNTLN